MPAMKFKLPDRSVRVCVTEPDGVARDGWSNCRIGSDIEFNIDRMATYFFKRWSPVIEDALLVAGAVEYCDMSTGRPAASWSRDIELQVPVFELAKWNEASVKDALHSALNHLTGDRWTVHFVQRSGNGAPRGQQPLELEYVAKAVIPFSDGLDSCSVAEIEGRTLGNALVRIRLGAARDLRRKHRRQKPFANVPYTVKGEHKEPSMRSRGFKFGVVSGLAAYLANSSRVIMPESGQGVIGPAIVPLGQAYPDFRSHPTFLRKHEKFLEALLGQKITFELPRLWNTKGETLKAHVDGCKEKSNWEETHSCWQQNRHTSVAGKRRHCGVCAACLLRRMSVHAAGLHERADQYVWENLSTPTFEEGAAPQFDRAKITGKMRQYAIAGTLHLDHLAAFIRSDTNQAELNLHIFQLARTCGLPETLVRDNLQRLLNQHDKEWRSFLDTLGESSFLRNWVDAA